MMSAREAAFKSSSKRRFDRQLFSTQTYQLRPDDETGAAREALVDLVVDHLATYPDGDGIGYFLVEGASFGRSVEQVREFSRELFGAVWERFRSRCRRIAPEREFFCAETVTEDGNIPIGLFGSHWSFKPPHADRNGVIFSHVYGPTVGFEGGDVFLIDAIAYFQTSGLHFDEALTWSDEPLEQKAVLRSEHFEAAVHGYGRRFGKMNHDRILFVNNTPEGLFHGATEIHAADPSNFSRVLHRCVVRERG